MYCYVKTPLLVPCNPMLTRNPHVSLILKWFNCQAFEDEMQNVLRPGNQPLDGNPSGARPKSKKGNF